jgi:hypothetical protein
MESLSTNREESMKKMPRKLSLSRETLRKLAGPELRKVRGAVHTDPCMTGDCPTAEVSCDPGITADTCDSVCC